MTITPRTVVMLALLAASGCATVHPEIRKSEDALADLERQPNVVRYAPRELTDAENAVARAKAHWVAHRDTEELKHLTYLAGRRMDVALVAAKEKRLEAESDELHAQRSDVKTDVERQKTAIAEQRREVAEVVAARERARADQREAELRALQASLVEFQARQEADELRLTLSDVLFETGKATLKPGAERKLEPLAEYLKRQPDQVARVEGHTDSMGDASYNQTLSLQRANAVRDALVFQGVSGDQVVTEGLGEAFPIASNEISAGRQENRRVEIIVKSHG